MGSTCFSLSAGGSACFLNCQDSAECRTAEGYVCDGDNTCYPGMGPPPCSMQNPDGTCPAGQTCQNGACQQFSCGDMRFEPNETASAAAAMPMGETTGLDLCAGDKDWYRLAVPPGKIGTVGITFQNNSGDLEFTAHDSGGQCVGGRIYNLCSWSFRGYETGEEFVSVLNMGQQDKEFTWQARGYNGAANAYALHAETVDWSDGMQCGAPYALDECQGRPGGVTKLVQFPHADANDPYVGDGYRFDSDSNYRWLRRETIMLVRYAIHETQLKFPGTLPLGLADMCQRDGITPGYDINDPRHPESTHDQGGNIDIAYFTTLAGGVLPYSQARIICGPGENDNNDGSWCTPAAATGHVVDLPRQAYFMAKLMEHPRLRVIGADKVIAPLLVAEAQRQLELGWITQTVRNKFNTKIASGDGWPFHHHHIHLSMNWWTSAKPGQGPVDGCGFQMTRVEESRR